MLYVHDITRATFEKCHYSGNVIFVGILFILSNGGKFPPEFCYLFIDKGNICMYNDKDIEREKLLYPIKITMFFKVC